MKTHIPLLFLSALTIAGCANNAAIKSSQNVQSQPSHHHSAEKNAECVNTKISPLSKCSETVSATFDTNGVLWVAWVNDDYIYVQSSKDKGVTFSAPLKVNTVAEPIAAKGESRPKIKLDKHGNIYLTWVQRLDKKYSTYVRFSRSIDGGQHFSAPVTVNDNVEIIRHRFDSLAIGQNGELFIAWLDARDNEAAKSAGEKFDGISLYYTWSDDGGQHFYPNKQIAAHTCECCRLDTAVNKANLPVVIWRHIFTGGIRDHAIVNFKDWNTPDEVARLSAENWQIDACPHHGPGLSIANNNVYHAVWFSNSKTKQGLFYAHSTDAGLHFSESVNFGNDGASHPHVLALGEHVTVVWQEFDGSHSIIKAIKSSDQGKNWSTPEAIAQATEVVDEPFLIADGQKSYLSWQVQHQDYRLILLNN